MNTNKVVQSNDLAYGELASSLLSPDLDSEEPLASGSKARWILLR